MTYTLHTPEGYKPLPLPYRNAWLSALRSGEYEQGYGALMSESASGKCYCCLGVLSHIQGRLIDATDCGHRWKLAQDNPSLSCDFKSLGDFPPNVIVTIDKLKEPFITLASLNDAGLSFTSIADIIEQLYVEPSSN